MPKNKGSRPRDLTPVAATGLHVSFKRFLLTPYSMLRAKNDTIHALLKFTVEERETVK